MNRIDKNKAVDQEVQKTLDSLDNLQRINANPFFYTRLKQRMDKFDARGLGPRTAAIKALRLALIPSLIVTATILLGIFIGYDSSSADRSRNIDSFASAYGLQTDDLNDYLLTGLE